MQPFIFHETDLTPKTYYVFIIFVRVWVHHQIFTAWWIIILQQIGLRVGDSIRLKVTILQTNIKLPHIFLI